MKPVFHETTSKSGKLCELDLHNQRHVVHLDLQFDHQRFDEPQRIYPVEEPQCEWEKVAGELYYLDRYAMVRGEGKGTERVVLATITAWYYPELRRLTLWRMTGLGSLKQSHRSTLDKDENVARIWERLETVLLAQFTETREIVVLATPFTFDDENRPWQNFLTLHRYQQHPSDKRRFRRFC